MGCFSDRRQATGDRRQATGDRRQADISLIRLIALIFIVTCHIQQYLNIELAWWFNIGVQMFLCISGYLYGQKSIEDVPEFYRKRAVKILVPYFITIAAFSILEYLLAEEYINETKVIKALLLKGTLDGGEHLWFVPTILMCYLLTPLLNIYKRKVYTEKEFWLMTITSIFFTSYFFGLFADCFNAAWMTCYVIGYMLGVNKDRGYLTLPKLIVIFAPLALLCNAGQIYCTYVINIDFRGYEYFCNYSHALLGITIVLLLKCLCQVNFIRDILLENCVVKQMLRTSDNYSYEIYLVHQFFILGPLSLMALTPSISVNIIIILGVVWLGGCTLAHIHRKCERFADMLVK